MATPTLSVSLSLTTTYQKLSTLLATAYPTINDDAVIQNIGFFSNLSGTISCYVAAGYTSAPSGSVGLLSPLQTVDFVEGLNANDVWVKSASGTPTMDFWIGATAGPAPQVTGVIGTITATTNTITKASSGNLVDSSITDDGTTVTTTEPLVVTGKISQASNDGGALGDATHNFSDLFLATGAVLNYANGNVAVTHSSGILTMGTGELRVTTPGTNSASVPTLGSTSTLTNKTLTAPVLNTGTVGTSLVPTTDDGAALGDTTHNFSDLFLASGAVLNFNNGNVAVTHSSGILTMGTGELRITTVGTNAASVPTIGSTSTFTNKTLTSPAINTPTINSGAALGATSTEIDQLNDVSAYQESVVAAGALSVTKVYSGVALVGAGAVTLAAPSATMLGQQKTIEMTADNGDVTLALTNVVGQSSGTTATFNDVRDSLILLALSDKWLVLKEYGISLS